MQPHPTQKIYECKVCLNMSRSTVSFISHKRTYCQLRYHQTRHEDVEGCKDSENDGENSPEDDGDPTKATTCFITPRHETDDENTTPPTTTDHPRVAPGDPTDTVPSDTNPNDSDRDVSSSPRGSHQSGDGSENGDSSYTDEVPEQEPTTQESPSPASSPSDRAHQ